MSTDDYRPLDVSGIALAHPHNWAPSRSLAPDLIVVHTMEGELYGTIRMMQEIQAKPRSYHLGIGKDGTVIQMVPLRGCAYHAGNLKFNHRSIGVAMEGSCLEDGWLTPFMYRALVRVTQDLCGRFMIPMTREHVIGHCHVPNPSDPSKLGGVSGHTDPGPFFPWDTFIADLKG